jgi:hypothetical protein
VAEPTEPYRCDVHGRPNLEQLMASIDLSDVHFE